MTQQEKAITHIKVKDALQRNDAHDLIQLAKSSDYALAAIINALCKKNELLIYIKNILE